MFWANLCSAEISDLLITKKVKESTRQILNMTQLSFHQIRKDEITQVSIVIFYLLGDEISIQKAYL